MRFDFLVIVFRKGVCNESYTTAGGNHNLMSF